MTKALTTEPVAVLISDLHPTLQTLDLVRGCLTEAYHEARRRRVPLVIAGDLTDGKAIMRAEVTNMLLEVFSKAAASNTYVLVGNHDKVNEKGEDHALRFLEPFASIISSPVNVVLGRDSHLPVTLIPYQTDPAKLQGALRDPLIAKTLIIHQGVLGADMGHYVQDKTSLPREAFAKFRVISGHYHKPQDIKCGPPEKGAVGLFSYLGSPYTQSFAEADGLPRGFSVLLSNGLLHRIPFKARKHVVIDTDMETLYAPDINGDLPFPLPEPTDIVWMKLRGPRSELARMSKKTLGALFGHTNFKLDLIPTDAPKAAKSNKTASEGAILDEMIDAMAETPEQKERLKALWKELMS